MNISSEELQTLLYNPYTIQKKILDELETSEGITISNANNAFMLLMETITATSHATAMECKNVIRKKFPILAKNMSDIYDHLDEDDINNMFAKPGSVDIKFYIPVLTLKNKGYKPAGANYREARIPKNTVLTVLGKTFTILNTIIVRIYDTSETPYVEVVQNDETLSLTNISVIESKIESDKNQQPYITFVLPVKQVKIGTVSKVISASGRTKFQISLTNKFVKMTITYKNAANNNTEVDLPVTLSSEYLNPTKPCAVLSVNDNVVNVEIPNMYVIDGSVSGEAIFTVYETEGGIFLPLESYSKETFTLTLGPITHQAEQVLTKEDIPVKGYGSLMGGSDGTSFEDLKKSIVYRTTGSIAVPVTNYQIEKIGSDAGFQIAKVEDTLLNRVFTASKDIPSFTSMVIQSIPDVFNNTIGITTSTLKTDRPECVREDNFIIKSGTVFKEENGILRMLTPEEEKTLENMPRNTKVVHFKENKYFFNFFTYVVGSSDGVTECKIWHLDFPKMESIRHYATNQNLANTVCYIDKYNISRTSTGYQILIKVEGSDGYKSEIEQGNKFVQISFDLNSGSKVYFVGEYDSGLDAHVFNINTDEFITTDGYIELLNGTSETPTKLTPLIGTMDVYCYIKDARKLDKSGYLKDYINDKDPNVSVLTYDTINFYFGKEIKYLWNKIYHTYTDKKYKTYLEDKRKVYSENVYETDNDGELVMTLSPNGQEITLNKLHDKGDEVVDDQGQPVYEYRKGDLVLDENGEPIVDVASGVIRYIDMLMLEYEYVAASASSHTQLNNMMVKYFEDILLDELPSINKNLLEQTKILYKSVRNTNPVALKANSANYSVQHRVSPTVTLYVDSSVDVSLSELEAYKFTIGSIINSEIQKSTISVPNIVDKIKSSLVISVLAVKITDLLPGEAQIATMSGTNRLVLDKSLSVAEYKETIVVYNINLVVEKAN